MLNIEKSLTNSTIPSEYIDKDEVIYRGIWKSILILKNIPGEHGLNEFFKYVYHLDFYLVHDELAFNALAGTDALSEYLTKYEFLLKKFFDKCQKGDQLTYQKWMEIDEQIRRLIVGQITSNRGLLKQLISFWKMSNYIALVSPEKLLDQPFFSPRKALESKPHCNLTIPQCGKGTEVKHSLFKEENWDNSYGWHCELCPPQTFKDIEGNSECKPCERPLTTDDLRTQCFDPFQTDYAEILSPLGVVICCVSGLNVFAILFTMVTFIRFRDTPMVKHANQKMTILHLVSHLILSIVPAFLFLGEPNKMTCTLKPVLVGVCFTISVAINIAKTQKLNLIFSSKTFISDGKKKLIDVVEFVVIAVLVILDV